MLPRIQASYFFAATHKMTDCFQVGQEATNVCSLIFEWQSLGRKAFFLSWVSSLCCCCCCSFCSGRIFWPDQKHKEIFSEIKRCPFGPRSRPPAVPSHGATTQRCDLPRRRGETFEARGEAVRSGKRERIMCCCSF